jgi:hypothetical protein
MAGPSPPPEDTCFDRSKRHFVHEIMNKPHGDGKTILHSSLIIEH